MLWRICESLTQMQLPFSTSPRAEAVATAAANISGISCHSRELCEPLPTTTAHVVYTLQAFDVRGVASDPHYLIKASLRVFVGISLNVCRPPHQSLAAMAVSPPLLFCWAFVALLTGYCQRVACDVTRGHTLAQQLQGITFDTKNKKQETRKLLTKSGDIYNFSYIYRLEVATELLLAVLIVGHCLHLLSSSVSSVYAHEFFFFFLNLCLCVCQAPVPSHVPSPVSTPGC